MLQNVCLLGPGRQTRAGDEVVVAVVVVLVTAAVVADVWGEEPERCANASRWALVWPCRLFAQRLVPLEFHYLNGRLSS